MNKLIIFDIDGTLTKTNWLDHYAYTEAVRKFIKPDFNEFDPNIFVHFTDSSMVVELFQHHQNRVPDADEIAAFKRFYLNLLMQVAAEQPQAFAPVHGANAMLAALPKDWDIALATGCWLESAEIKLQFSGVHNALPLPKGTASDAISRGDVTHAAIAKSLAFYKKEKYDRIIYVGDGIWDVRTCAALGLPLIGIEAENNEEKRQRLGRHWLLTDYADIQRFVELMENVGN